MKKIPLTKGKFALVDDSDFEYLTQWKWATHSSGYAVRDKKSILMHRVINQTPKGFETDHINRNKLDNRRANLRTVTMSQNKMNTGLQANNTSGHKGVHWYKRKSRWQAYIKKDGKRYHLGFYEDLADAIRVRSRAEKELWSQ